MRVSLLIGAFGLFFIAAHLSFGPLGAAAPAAAQVHMRDSAFAPAEVSIATGQTVEFVNDDEAPHTVAGGKAFDSGDIQPGRSWSHTFDTAGTFVYGCAYHAWMHGTVKVEPVAQNVRSSARYALK